MRRATPVTVWLLVGQLVVDLVLVALLGAFIYRATRVMNMLPAMIKTATGTEWKLGALADVLSRAATAIELEVTATGATAQAIQVLVRDARSPNHAQPPPADSMGLIQPDV